MLLMVVFSSDGEDLFLEFFFGNFTRKTRQALDTNFRMSLLK